MLWAAVACLQREEPSLICVVYTGDVVDASKEDMLAKVQVSHVLSVRPARAQHFRDRIDSASRSTRGPSLSWPFAPATW